MDFPEPLEFTSANGNYEGVPRLGRCSPRQKDAGRSIPIWHDVCPAEGEHLEL